MNPKGARPSMPCQGVLGRENDQRSWSPLLGKTEKWFMPPVWDGENRGVSGVLARRAAVSWHCHPRLAAPVRRVRLGRGGGAASWALPPFLAEREDVLGVELGRQADTCTLLGSAFLSQCKISIWKLLGSEIREGRCFCASKQPFSPRERVSGSVPGWGRGRLPGHRRLPWVN